jgi:hypothetical protein
MLFSERQAKESSNLVRAAAPFGAEHLAAWAKIANQNKDTMKECVALALAASALFLAGCSTRYAAKWEYKVASPHLPHGFPDANRAEGSRGRA